MTADLPERSMGRGRLLILVLALSLNLVSVSGGRPAPASEGALLPATAKKNGDVPVFFINALFSKIETSPFSSAPSAAASALAGRRAVLISPEAPRPGGPLRVLAAFESDAAKVRLFLRGPSGEVEPVSTKRGGGPPFWIAAEFDAAPSGRFSAVLREGREEVTVDPSGDVEIGEGWSWASESLYAA